MIEIFKIILAYALVLYVICELFRVTYFLIMMKKYEKLSDSLRKRLKDKYDLRR